MGRGREGKGAAAPAGLKWTVPAALRTPEHQMVARRLRERGRPLRFSAGDIVALGLMPAPLCGSDPIAWRRRLCQFLTDVVATDQPTVEIPDELWTVDADQPLPAPGSEERGQLQQQCLRVLGTIASDLLPRALARERAAVCWPPPTQEPPQSPRPARTRVAWVGDTEPESELIQAPSPASKLPRRSMPPPHQVLLSQVEAALAGKRVAEAVRFSLRFCAAVCSDPPGVGLLLSVLLDAPVEVRRAMVRYMDTLPWACGEERELWPAMAGTPVGEGWSELREDMEAADRWDDRLLSNENFGLRRSCVVLRLFSVPHGRCGFADWVKVAIGGQSRGFAGWTCDVPLAALVPRPADKLHLLQRVRITADPTHMRHVMCAGGRVWRSYKGEACGCLAIVRNRANVGNWFCVELHRNFRFDLPAALVSPVPDRVTDMLAVALDASTGDQCHGALLSRLPASLRVQRNVPAWRTRVLSLALSLRQVRILRSAIISREWVKCPANADTADAADAGAAEEPSLPTQLFQALREYPPWGAAEGFAAGSTPGAGARTEPGPAAAADAGGGGAATAAAAATDKAKGGAKDRAGHTFAVALAQLCADAALSRHGADGKLNGSAVRRMLQALAPDGAGAAKWPDQQRARLKAGNSVQWAQLKSWLQEVGDEELVRIAGVLQVPVSAAVGRDEDMPETELVAACDVPAITVDATCAAQGCNVLVSDVTCTHMSDAVITCAMCKVVHYCSKDCQKRDWTDRHGWECPQTQYLQAPTLLLKHRPPRGAGFRRFTTNLHSHCSYCQVELAGQAARPLLCAGCDAVVACSLLCIQQHDAVPLAALAPAKRPRQKGQPRHLTRLHDLCWHFRVSWAPEKKHGEEVWFPSAADTVQGLRNARAERRTCPCGEQRHPGTLVCSGCRVQTYCGSECMEEFRAVHQRWCTHLRLSAESGARELCRAMRRASQHLRAIVGDGTVSCQLAGSQNHPPHSHEPLTDASAEVGLGNAWRKDPNWRRCISQLWTPDSVLCDSPPLKTPLEVLRGDLCVTVNTLGRLTPTMVLAVKPQRLKHDPSPTPFLASRRLCACRPPREHVLYCPTCQRSCCTSCCSSHDCARHAESVAKGQVSTQPKLMRMTACFSHLHKMYERSEKEQEMAALERATLAPWQGVRAALLREAAEKE